jgi:hypothetical protein
VDHHVGPHVGQELPDGRHVAYVEAQALDAGVLGR